MEIKAISSELKQYRKSKNGKTFYKKGNKKAFAIERKAVGSYIIEFSPALINNLPIIISVHK